MAVSAAKNKTDSKKTNSKAASAKSKPAASSAAKSRTSSKQSASAASAKTAAAKAKERESRRFWSYILFFGGILELLLTFIEGDGFWNTLHCLNRGLFGIASFMLAPMMIYVALMVAYNTTHNTVVAKTIEGSVLMLLASGISQILQVGSVEGSNFFKKLAGLYNDGVQLRGGGLASAILGWPLLAVFKKVGATIIILVVAFTFVMLLTDITLPQLLKGLGKPIVKGYNAVTEDRIERVMYNEERRMNPPQRPRRPRVERTYSNGPERVDIAKYFPDDQPETAAEVYKKVDANEEVDNENFEPLKDMPEHPVRAPKITKERLEEEVNKTDDKELKRIIRKALGSEEKKDSKEQSSSAEVLQADENLPEMINIESDGQTTFFEKDNKISAYVYPPVQLLKFPKNKIDKALTENEIQEKSTRMVETLESFSIKTRIVGIFRGPSVTRYELQPAAGVKVDKIKNYTNDIALNLAAVSVRIEAPIPGKACVGIEVSNNIRDVVSLRELIDSEEYRNSDGKLTFAVGKDIEGKIIIGDMAKMPHLLVAGTTGSGKSVFTNSIILSILYHASPNEVKLILIDPKQVEFKAYDNIPHLLIPVVTEPLKAAGALGWAVNEMEKRYSQFTASGVRNLEGFNNMINEEHAKPVDQQDPILAKIDPMPQILIVIDEFADLMMAAGKEVEDSVLRLGQKARAAGIHMIIATQSPRKDVITGLIKSNIPSRVALSVSSTMDSMVIFDQGGAEKLLGNGDLLYKPVGIKAPMRIQSGYASDKEIKDVVDFLKSEHTSEYNEEIMAEVEENMPKPKEDKKGGGMSDEDIVVNPDDALIDQAISIIIQTGNASTSFLQRRLKLGFARAARIMDEIEERGIIGPNEGNNKRSINISMEEWQEMKARR